MISAINLNSSCLNQPTLKYTHLDSTYTFKLVISVDSLGLRMEDEYHLPEPHPFTW